MSAITGFEADVGKNFLAVKFGNRDETVADIDVHFVLPVLVYAKYGELIGDVTGGQFNVGAGYNLVALYVEARDAQRAGTVMFGRDIAGLISAWPDFLDEIALEPDAAERRRMFDGAHSHFRSALWIDASASDPCASKRPLLKKVGSKPKPFWSKFRH